MVFKQKSIVVRKEQTIIGNLFWILAIIIVFFIWFFSLQYINSINFNLDERILNIDISNDNSTWSTDFINIMLIWRWWWNHDAPDLTDTIIIANINLKKNIVNMLSIPRDLYVEYPGGWGGKINEIYLREWVNKWDKDLWIKALENKLTEITWEKIDYYLSIDFKWFIELIDVFWWVEITLDENFVDYQYPDWNLGYTTFLLKKWTWVLDWEVALKYVRSRHSTSDFDRSYRQQQVIKSLKDKIVSQWFLKNTLKIKSLYDIFNKYIETDLWLESIIKLSYFWKNADNTKFSSFNLNDSCFYWSASCQKWGFLYVPSRDLFNNLSVLLVDWSEKWDISNYDKIKSFSDLIFNKSWLFIENYKINILNWTKTPNLANNYATDIKRYWFNIPEYNSVWNTDIIYDKSIIYYKWIPDNSETLQWLKTIFNWEIIESEDIYNYDKWVNINIIIWKDYLEAFNL